MTDARSPRAPAQYEKVRSDAASAVDFERDSGQERRVVRSQEEHRLGDVVGRGKPAKRNGRLEFLAVLRCVRYTHEGLEHTGLTDHGTDRIDPHLVRRKLHGQRFGQVTHSTL